MYYKIQIFSLFLFLTTSVSAQIKLSGIVDDAGTKNPLEFANVVLLKSDSSFIAGTSCDSLGSFSFSNLSQGDYILSSTYVGYNKSYFSIAHLDRDLTVDNIHLNPSAAALKEVTVTGASIIQKADRKLLIPSEAQKRASNSGTALLRNLQLSRIEVNPLDNAITTLNGDAVQLRINGVEVTKAEVVALQPQDIIRIEYHDDPGMRYGNAAAVIDFITRRRDSGGSVSADLQNALWRLGFADDYLSAKVNRKKSEFGVNAYYNYRNVYWTRENRQTFFFPDEAVHQDEIGKPTNVDTKSLNLVANYNLNEPDKYMLNVAFRNNYNNTPNNFTDRNSTLYTYSSGDTVRSSISDLSTWRNNTPSLDIYFQRNLKHDQLIIFDAVGTYMNSKSTRLYRQTRAGADLFTSYSCITGNKYSLITEGIYEKKWESSTLTAGLKHSQSYTENNYTGSVASKVGLSIAETYGYTEYLLRRDKFNYTLGLGVTRMFIGQDRNSLEKYIFRPQLRVLYNIDKNAYIRYSGNVSTYPPSLSDMNNVTQVIDAWQVQQGNPNLQTAWYMNNQIFAGYNRGIFGAELYAQYFHIHKPAMEYTFLSDSIFVHTVINQGAYRHIYSLIALRLKPWKERITLSVVPTFDRYIMEGNDYLHTYNNWSIRASIMAVYKKLVFYAEAHTPRNDFYGETLNINERMVTFAAGYTTPKWTAGVMLLNPFSKNFPLATKNFSELTPYVSNVSTDNLGRIVTFKLTFNLNFGRKYNAANKRLDNTDTDAGIMTGTKK